MQHMLYPFATEQIVGKVDLHFSPGSSRFDLLLNPALAFSHQIDFVFACGGKRRGRDAG